MSLPDMEIHMTNGVVKIIEGPARRTYHSTPEAVGLALLKLRPNETSNVAWQDFLTTKGVAFAAQGTRALTLLVLPVAMRTMRWGRDSTPAELKVKMPSLLFAIKFEGRTLSRSSLWVIKPGQEGHLITTGTDHILCPFPYGNVYNHGGICWGTTDIRSFNHPSEVEDAFFGSIFNGDLLALNVIGAFEHSMADLVRRVKEDLPAPTKDNYTKSVSEVAVGLLR